MSLPIELPRTRSSRNSIEDVFLRVPKGLEDYKAKKGSVIKQQLDSSIEIVNKEFGKFKDKYILLTEEQKIIDYFNEMSKVGYGAIDTETTGVDSLVCDIVGIPVYSVGLPPAYIPLGHTSHITGNEVENQASKELLVDLLTHSVIKWILHNGKFDYKVLKNTLNVELSLYWDTFTAMHILNEHEDKNNLKYLHNKFCSDSQWSQHEEGEQDKDWTYGAVFGKLPASIIPIETFMLYAAGDGPKTYDLYEFQKFHFEKPKLKKLYWVYKNLEVANLAHVGEMELYGVKFDKQRAFELKSELEPEVKKFEKQFHKLLNPHEEEIKSFIDSHPGTVLEYPVSISSPAQLSVLFYDILKYPVVDNKKPRTTDSKALIKLNTDISIAVSEYRKFVAPINMFLDKLPNKVNEKTGRIHCEFKPEGTDTGRFSSKSPNLQQIQGKPPGDKVRQVFTVPDDSYFASIDYCAQEPRITAHLSQDKKMIDAYKTGYDLYSFIASQIFHTSYENCLEFNNGVYSKEGKKRRSVAKTILLGITYGKQVKSISVDLNMSVEEAQSLFDLFYETFPNVKKWMDETIYNARRLGYIETVYGRKRRFPEFKLPKYSFIHPKEIASDKLMMFWSQQLNRCRNWNDKLEIMRRCESETGFKVEDNKMKILEAERQAINACVQGTAADIGKLALGKLCSNKDLKNMGVHLLIPIHDEFCFEIPKIYIKEALLIIEYCMISVCKNEISIPMEVDISVMDRWEGNKIDIK